MDVEKLNICSCRTSGCYVCSSRFLRMEDEYGCWEAATSVPAEHLDVMYVVQGSPNGR